MKAMLSFVAMLALIGIQFSCTAPSHPVAQNTKQLTAPEVAVMRVRNTVLVAWKPVDQADGYFVYRETQDPPAKTLLGIGPKDASAFIDRDPPHAAASYSVQAFQASAPSERLETKPMGGSAERISSHVDL